MPPLPIARAVLPIAKPLMPQGKPVLPIANPVTPRQKSLEDELRDTIQGRDPQQRSGEDLWTAWMPVVSTNVKMIRYNHGKKEMEVVFDPVTAKTRIPRMYRYFNVPEDDWEMFRNAPSYGMYVWYQIREGNATGGKYLYEGPLYSGFPGTA